MANTCQTDHVTSSPWPLTLEVMALHVVRLFMLQLCIKFEVRRPYNSADDPLPLSALVGLMSYDFDLWSLELETGAHYCPLYTDGVRRPVSAATFLPILVFLWLLILDVWPTPVRRITWACDIDLWPWRSWCLSVIRNFVLHLHIQFEVRRPFRSDDMTHFRSQHKLTSRSWPWPWKWFALLSVGWSIFLPIVVFLGRFVLNLSVNLWQTLTFDLGGHVACEWYVPSSIS